MDGFNNFEFYYPEKATETAQKEFKSLFLTNVKKSDQPALHILGLLFSTNKPLCKTAIIEKEYIDSDYIDSYARYYFQCYHDYSKKCTRVHFFTSIVKEEDLLDLNNDHKKAYLGFITIRPTEVYKMGKTLLKPIIACDDSRFPLCNCQYPVHLAGNDLNVWGCAFIQQDIPVSACTTSALWMAHSALRTKLELEQYSMPQITEMGTRSSLALGNPTPTKGLTGAQMMEALRSMGYEPLGYDTQRPEEQLNTIYRYVESELPVIINTLSVSSGYRHSLVVIGHRYDPTAELLENDKGNKYCSSVRWVPSFLVNDDIRGPYLDMTLATAEGDKTIAIVDTLEGLYILSTIIPLPKGVSLPAEKAEAKARKALDFSKKLFSKKFNINVEFKNNLVLRTYLRRSDDFKSQVRPCVEVKAIYRNMLMPENIWVTEINTVEYMKKKNCEERKTIGEIIIDPNSNQLIYEDFIALHLTGELTPENLPGKDQYPNLGYFVCARRKDKNYSLNDTKTIAKDHEYESPSKWQFYEIHDDPPYPHLARSIEKLNAQ